MVKHIISDLHLGHKNLARFRRIIDSNGECLRSEELHELVLDSLICMSKRDMVWILGDCCFTDEYLTRMKKIKARLLLVGGNHDLALTHMARSNVFSNIYGVTKHKGYWLSHAPIHTDELRGCKNIHGHTQTHLIPDTNYINVCVEYTGIAPIKWEYATSDEYYQECQKKWREVYNGK